MEALAYLLTFSTYGTHLPGSEKGWVDARHRTPGTPMLTANHEREAYWRLRMLEPPWILGAETKVRTLEAILGVCKHRGWIAHAVHVRRTHVHAVVSGDLPPEKMLADFKAYATGLFDPPAQRTRDAVTGPTTEVHATSGMK